MNSPTLWLSLLKDAIYSKPSDKWEVVKITVEVVG